jgi:Bacterial pre-peptidase C-terminal domain
MQSQMRQFGGLLLAALAGVSWPQVAGAQVTVALPAAIQIALCSGDQAEAMALTGQLIASPDLDSTQRAALVAFRHQLGSQPPQPPQPPLADGSVCQAVLAQLVPAATVPNLAPPLDWEKAIAAVSGLPYLGPPDQVARQNQGFIVAGLARQVQSPIEALSPAVPIDTRSGAGVVAGGVSQDHRVFSFVGGKDDQVTVDIEVTQVLPGILYTDDDSQLFLFDSQGRLLANNDDLNRLQSRISSFVLPASDTYYVVVTTYNNDPILDAEGRVTGWSGNGGSFIDFTLAVTGLTPTAELVMPAPAAVN